MRFHRVLSLLQHTPGVCSTPTTKVNLARSCLTFRLDHVTPSQTRGWHSAEVPKTKSLYEILGVTESADSETIKKAFYDLSKKVHPDLNPNDPNATQQFRDLAAAYEVLSNAESRKQYDLERGQSTRRPPSWQPRSSAGATHEYQTKKGVNYGIDPEWGRKVDVDMSPERMAKAWEAYKLRWEREEEQRKAMEERKIKFRQDLDKKREEAYASMTVEEIAKMREDMKLLRKPGKINSARAKAEGEKNKRQDEQEEANLPPEPTLKNYKEFFAYYGYDVDERGATDKAGFLDVAYISRQIKEGREDMYGKGAGKDEDSSVAFDMKAEYSGYHDTAAKMKKRKELHKAFKERQRKILEEERRAEDEVFSAAAAEKRTSDAAYAQEFFAEGAKRGREQFESAKEQWKEARFFSDPGGSSHASGDFIPRGYSMPLYFVRLVGFVTIFGIAMEVYFRYCDGLEPQRRAAEFEVNVGKKE